MTASAHWCIIFEAEVPFVQSSINQSDKSLKIALQSKRKPNDPCRETLKQKEIQNNKETYIQIWIEIGVEIEWQPDLSLICSWIWLACPVWEVSVAQRRPQAQWTISPLVSMVDETSAPTVSSQWVFFSCLLTIQCVSQLFVFHLFIHTVTLMLVVVFHHERTLSPLISQIEMATCHTLLRPQCNIFTTCLACRRLEGRVKINYWCPPRLTRRAVCALVLQYLSSFGLFPRFAEAQSWRWSQAPLLPSSSADWVVLYFNTVHQNLRSRVTLLPEKRFWNRIIWVDTSTGEQYNSFAKFRHFCTWCDQRIQQLNS